MSSNHSFSDTRVPLAGRGRAAYHGSRRAEAGLRSGQVADAESVQTHTCEKIQKLPSWPHLLCVFGPWEEAAAPGENLRGQKKDFLLAGIGRFYVSARQIKAARAARIRFLATFDL